MHHAAGCWPCRRTASPAFAQRSRRPRLRSPSAAQLHGEGQLRGRARTIVGDRSYGGGGRCCFRAASTSRSRPANSRRTASACHRRPERRARSRWASARGHACAPSKCTGGWRYRRLGAHVVPYGGAGYSRVSLSRSTSEFAEPGENVDDASPASTSSAAPSTCRCAGWPSAAKWRGRRSPTRSATAASPRSFDETISAARRSA